MSVERTNDDILDLLPAYVLGALEPDEMIEVATYLEEHPELDDRVAEAEAAVAQLAYLAPDAPLPSDAKQRLIDRAQGTTVMLAPHAAVPSSPPAAPVSAWWQRLRDLFWTTRWGVAMAAIVGLLAWNIALQRTANDVARLERIVGAATTEVSLMIDTPAAPDARGRFFLPADGTAGVIAVTGLPQLPPGKDYQFWFARPDDSRDSAAVFEVGPNGEALVEVPLPAELTQYNEIWITQEPDGGSAVPTAPHYLEGPLVQ